MAEELRFFLRVALFAGALAVVYWFVSYEEAGSVLLAGVLVGAGVFALAAGGLASPADRPPGHSAGLLRRTLGFDEPGDGAALAVEDEAVARQSAWPPVVAIGALLVGAGLVFGPWLWIPGAVLGAAAAWGWATELEG